jgi:hypothetical protein
MCGVVEVGFGKVTLAVVFAKLLIIIESYFFSKILYTSGYLMHMSYYSLNVFILLIICMS